MDQPLSGNLKNFIAKTLSRIKTTENFMLSTLFNQLEQKTFRYDINRLKKPSNKSSSFII